ncbi:MAG: hypothetical protein RLY86_712 [Pseudomonadota bacterium]|jgi:predicted nuclease of predicted toxin-antitoxin system
MTLLVDMTLSPRRVGLSTGVGLQATHWSQLGPGDAPDADIMAFARGHGLVVLTHDLDFGAILAAPEGDRPSVVRLRAADGESVLRGGDHHERQQALGGEGGGPPGRKAGNRKPNRATPPIPREPVCKPVPQNGFSAPEPES